MSNRPQKRKKLLPKLRFPEFKNAGEWEVKSLLDVCERITQGGTPDTSKASYWNGAIEWLTPAEMEKTESRFIHSTARRITEDGLKSCSSELLPVHSVILSTRAPIGHLAINTAEMAINQGCKGLIPKRTTDHNFLYYILRSSKLRLSDLGAGNTFKELSGGALKYFSVRFPTHEEQKKIADCLSSLDDLIEAQAQKLEALKRHKKGLMQQLFPAKDETLPKLRFPEFRGAREWGEKSLDEICDVNPPNSDLPESFIYIDLESVLEGKLLARKRIGKDSAPSRAQRLLVSGDVIFQIVRPYQGNNLFCNFGSDDHYVVSTGYAQLRAFESSRFLYHAIHSDDFMSSVIGKCTGSNYPAINSSDLAKILLKVPEREEQLIIADCLSSLDELIEAEAKKLEALRRHKKGLMQQLFPAASEARA